MVSSGTYSYNPGFSDLLLEVFSRIQVRPTSLTADHMYQARMSANLLLSEWSVRAGPNLWEVELVSVPLQQGVATFSVPTNVVALLDCYCRQFQVGNPVNLAPAFTTTLNSNSVAVAQANHGLIPGNWMAVVVPVSIGGIVLQGFYQVNTVIDVNDYTILAASAATSGTSGGTVPSFTSAAGSVTITVTLANHGLVPNQNFNVQVPTLVSGVTLSGVYPVKTVPSANTFTITAPYPAAGVVTVFENAGNAQLEGQVPNVSPVDFVLFPISRSEYSAQPNKTTQARPTTYWWDRTINSTITMWQVPDGNGPYTFNYYAMTQMQDVTTPNGTTLDMPYRFLEAFASGLAAKLARKFAPALVQELRAEADMAWQSASMQDSENVPLYISPGLSSYFR